MRRFDEGAKAFRRALQIRPGHAGAHNNLGMALNSLGDTHGAIEQFRAAIAAEPNYVARAFQSGQSSRCLRPSADAVAALQNVLRLQPQLRRRRIFGLGHALAAIGRHERRCRNFERAVGLDPQLRRRVA